MKELIRWGIIGNSDISRKRGAPAIIAGQERRLAAIYSRDLDRASQFCRDHGDARDGGTRPYGDLAAFLDDPELDAVYISSELYRHCAETIACAEAGKHVLCEKPMALDPGECARMIDACRAHNVRLAVLFPRRYFPKIEIMRNLIAEGAIGRPVTARISASGGFDPDTS